MRIQNVIAAVLLIASATLRGDAVPKGPGDDAFEKMKTLVGTWEATVPTGIQRAEFQLIANGSVIMSRLSGGMPHDMHTMLHMDGSEFMLTHYCAMRNQPRMVLAPGRDPNKLVFEFKDGRNIKPGDVYMNRVAFSIGPGPIPKPTHGYCQRRREDGSLVSRRNHMQADGPARPPPPPHRTANRRDPSNEKTAKPTDCARLLDNAGVIAGLLKREQ